MSNAVQTILSVKNTLVWKLCGTSRRASVTENRALFIEHGAPTYAARYH